jgi:hypothetical protein
VRSVAPLSSHRVMCLRPLACTSVRACERAGGLSGFDPCRMRSLCSQKDILSNHEQYRRDLETKRLAHEAEMLRIALEAERARRYQEVRCVRGGRSAATRPRGRAACTCGFATVRTHARMSLGGPPWLPARTAPRTVRRRDACLRCACAFV